MEFLSRVHLLWYLPFLHLYISCSRSEIPGKFWNVVLEKDGEDQLDRSCEKWKSIRVEEQRNILHEISKRKANWMGHILRRNCLLQRVTEGKIKGGIQVTGRRGRRRRKLLDDLKERRWYSHLKEEALDRTMWRNRFGGGFGPVVRQNTEWINLYTCCKIYSWTSAFWVSIRYLILTIMPRDLCLSQRYF